MVDDEPVGWYQHRMNVKKTDDDASQTVKMSADELRRQLHELGVDVDAAEGSSPSKPTSSPSQEHAAD